MGLLTTLRRAAAYALYTPPAAPGALGILSEQGIVGSVVDSAEKRAVIRSLAYHKGRRRRYHDDAGWNYAINALASDVVSDDVLDVSTDPTDYDELDTFNESVKEARKAHLVEEVLPALVNLQVVEVKTDEDEEEWGWDDNQYPGVTVVGIRPGPRFERAFDAVRWVENVTTPP